jgi:hypothetical protein
MRVGSNGLFGRPLIVLPLSGVGIDIAIDSRRASDGGWFLRQRITTAGVWLFIAEAHVARSIPIPIPTPIRLPNENSASQGIRPTRRPELRMTVGKKRGLGP